MHTGKVIKETEQKLRLYSGNGSGCSEAGSGVYLGKDMGQVLRLAYAVLRQACLYATLLSKHPLTLRYVH